LKGRIPAREAMGNVAVCLMRRVIDLIKTNANGAELGPVLETIENALRADQAQLIEAE
jgi:hypothetical protein